MPNDRAHKPVDLPAQVDEHNPAQAQENLPPFVEPPLPTIHHEEFTGSLCFDADTLDFSALTQPEPEFVINPGSVDVDGTMFTTLNEFGAAVADPNDGFSSGNISTRSLKRSSVEITSEPAQLVTFPKRLGGHQFHA